MTDKDPTHSDVKSEALLWKPGEAAEALRISMRSLHTLTKSGRIPHIRLGRMVRYSPAQLQDRIEQQGRGQ